MAKHSKKEVGCTIAPGWRTICEMARSCPPGIIAPPATSLDQVAGAKEGAVAAVKLARHPLTTSRPVGSCEQHARPRCEALHVVG